MLNIKFFIINIVVLYVRTNLRGLAEILVVKIASIFIFPLVIH